MKISHCEYCGEDLGHTEDKYPGDPMVVCGDPKCSREAMYDEQAAREEARWRAEEDDYGYYR